MANLSSVSDSVRDQITENHGNDPRRWPKELAILFDDTIQARPLNLPGVGQINIKNKEMCYHWVRRPMGPNPDLTRYMQLKTAGFQNATLEDVDPLVSSVNADSTEITCGQDLILMKAPPAIYYGAIKAHQQRAINMTNPRTTEGRERMMKSMGYGDQAALNATRTNLMSPDEQDTFASRATPENSTKQGTPKWDKIVQDAEKSKGAK
jgi:hypothetical protein